MNSLFFSDEAQERRRGGCRPTSGGAAAPESERSPIQKLLTHLDIIFLALLESGLTISIKAHNSPRSKERVRKKRKRVLPLLPSFDSVRFRYCSFTMIRISLCRPVHSFCLWTDSTSSFVFMFVIRVWASDLVLVLIILLFALFVVVRCDLVCFCTRLVLLHLIFCWVVRFWTKIMTEQWIQVYVMFVILMRADWNSMYMSSWFWWLFAGKVMCMNVLVVLFIFLQFLMFDSKIVEKEEN